LVRRWRTVAVDLVQLGPDLLSLAAALDAMTALDRYMDSINELANRKMLDIAREQESELVRACRRGEPFIDFPSEFGGSTMRKVLPRTLAGRWWKLRQAGYRLRGPR
jgi:hypothetical protein